jgi:hypothetical protein
MYKLTRILSLCHQYLYHSLESKHLHRHFNLLFEEPKQKNSLYSSYLENIYKAEQALIHSVRLLNINHREEQHKKIEVVEAKGKGAKKKASKSKSQSVNFAQYFDAISLDFSFYSNNEYFFEMMRLIRQNNSSFLSRPLS